MRRIAKHRSDQVNRLDEEKLSFHRTVRQAFLQLQKADPDRIKLIDASQPLEKVIQDVKQTIHAKFADLF